MESRHKLGRQAQGQGRKPGPQPLGDRHAISVRVPEEYWKVYEEAWQQEGFANMSDYVNAILAEHHGLQVPGWIRIHKDQPQQEVLLRAG